MPMLPLLLALLQAAPAATVPTAPATSPDARSPMIRSRIMAADTNHDGRISLAEFTAARQAHQKPGRATPRDPAKMFARIDSDHDGFLSTTEIDTMVARRMAHSGRHPAP